MQAKRRALKPTMSPAPWGLALGCSLVITCFVGANIVTDDGDFNASMSSSVTTGLESARAENQVTLSRNLTQGSLPLGTAVTAVVCRDSSGARLDIERAGSEHVLSGRFHEELVSPEPVSLIFSFSGAEMSDEDSIVFNQGGGELHGKNGKPLERVQKLEVKELKHYSGATLVVQTKKLQMEFTNCQVNAAAMLRLTKFTEQRLASIK